MEIEEVNCKKHGITACVEFSIDDKVIGQFCFKCLAELISKNIKNYVKIKKK